VVKPCPALSALLSCDLLCLIAVQIVAFGSISAMFNPAAALSQVVAGNLSARQFFTVIAGEMAGAILGGLTVYLLYMPQLYKAGAKVGAIT
jgi:glycerol uptake facilitator-like aquaporin